MDAGQLSVLVLGNIERTEMRPVADALVADSSALRIARLESIAAAIEHVRDGSCCPDLVVVCQSWPDEFPTRQVEQLLGWLPMAGCICCFGAWCEGDGRTREIWPISVRMSARCAAAQIHKVLNVLRSGGTPPCFTASRDEAFEFDRSPVAAAQSNAVSVHVISEDRPLRELWQDVLTETGCHVNRTDEAQDVIVYDVDARLETAIRPLQDLMARNPQSRVVAAAGLAHPEDVELLTNSGVHSVVTKLDSNQTLVDAVLAAVDQS